MVIHYSRDRKRILKCICSGRGGGEGKTTSYLKVRIIVASLVLSASLAPGAEADLAQDQDGHLDALRPCVEP